MEHGGQKKMQSAKRDKIQSIETISAEFYRPFLLHAVSVFWSEKKTLFIVDYWASLGSISNRDFMQPACRERVKLRE